MGNQQAGKIHQPVSKSFFEIEIKGKRELGSPMHYNDKEEWCNGVQSTDRRTALRTALQ